METHSFVGLSIAAAVTLAVFVTTAILPGRTTWASLAWAGLFVMGLWTILASLHTRAALVSGVWQVLFVAVVVLDPVRAWRAERGALTESVWQANDPEEACDAADRLRAAGIPAYVHGLRLRSLTRAAGPWAPLEVRVEAVRVPDVDGLLV